MSQNGDRPIDNNKLDHLTPFRTDDSGEKLTTNQGLRIQDDQNSLRAGERGPSLLEDFHLREKITHFDHERIPERVVHARDAAAQREITTVGGAREKVDFTFLTAGSVLFDAVYVPDGQSSVQALATEPKAVHFINESFNHCKTIGASGAGVELLRASAVAAILEREGVVVAETADGMVADFATALARHRHWSREQGAPVPAQAVPYA